MMFVRRCQLFSFSRISSLVGKRSTSSFEKIRSPSTTTSKIPLPPAINSASAPVSVLIASAKLTACGL